MARTSSPWVNTDQLPHCTITNAEAFDACQQFLKAALPYFHKVPGQKFPQYDGQDWMLWFAENSVHAGILCWTGHLLIRYVEEQGWDDWLRDEELKANSHLLDELPTYVEQIDDLIRAISMKDEVNPFDWTRGRAAIEAVCEIQMRIAAYRYTQVYNHADDDPDPKSLSSRAWQFLNGIPEIERRHVTARQLSNALNCALGAISGITAWKQEIARRDAAGIRLRGSRAKLQKLTAAMQIGHEDPNLAALLNDEFVNPRAAKKSADDGDNLQPRVRADVT